MENIVSDGNQTEKTAVKSPREGLESPYIICEDEFQWRMLSVTNEDPNLMVKSEWPCMIPTRFFVYRLSVAIAITVLTVANGWLEFRRYHEAWPWFSFATNWGILAMNFVLWNLAVYAAVYVMDPEKLIKGDGMPFCLWLSWALYNAMATSAFVITGCYWAYLFGIDRSSTVFRTPESYVKHALNSFVIVLDVLVSAIPIRLLHVVFPVAFAVIYCVFSYLWYVYDGPLLKDQESIYSVLDWREPGMAAAFICLNISLLVVSQTALLLLYRIRIYVQRQFCAEEEYQEIGGSVQ